MFGLVSAPIRVLVLLNNTSALKTSPSCERELLPPSCVEIAHILSLKALVLTISSCVTTCPLLFGTYSVPLLLLHFSVHGVPGFVRFLQELSAPDPLGCWTQSIELHLQEHWLCKLDLPFFLATVKLAPWHTHPYFQWCHNQIDLSSPSCGLSYCCLLSHL